MTEEARAPQSVTEGHINNLVSSEEYITPGNAPTLTLCVLVLTNGFSVVGESACADPLKFDADLGRRLARENAMRKVWAFEGYLLRQKLHDQGI